MNLPTKAVSISIILSLCFFLILSCSKNDKTESAEKQVENLIIGLMPAVDTAPIFLAKDKGYFTDENLELDIIVFTNAQDRQSALQSGEIDGAMTDLVAAAVNIAGGFPIKATMLTDGMFPILLQPGSGEKEVVKIGLMEISVSNFLVDHWLSDDYKLEKVFINSIPARLEAVVSNQLDMGLFPEPIASVGLLRGLEKKIYPSVDGYCPDAMVFTESALKKETALKAFHSAYNRAVIDINTDANEARNSIMKNISNLSPELKDLFELPVYHQARLPDEAFLMKIIEWTDSITDQEINISPQMIVDRSYTKN